MAAELTRDPEEIRRDIERTREEIAASLVHLRDSVSDATDWRVWVRRRPLACLAGAAGLGLVLGLR